MPLAGLNFSTTASARRSHLALKRLLTISPGLTIRRAKAGSVDHAIEHLGQFRRRRFRCPCLTLISCRFSISFSRALSFVQGTFRRYCPDTATFLQSRPDPEQSCNFRGLSGRSSGSSSTSSCPPRTHGSWPSAAAPRPSSASRHCVRSAASQRICHRRLPAHRSPSGTRLHYGLSE